MFTILIIQRAVINPMLYQETFCQVLFQFHYIFAEFLLNWNALDYFPWTHLELSHTIIGHFYSKNYWRITVPNKTHIIKLALLYRCGLCLGIGVPKARRKREISDAWNFVYPLNWTQVKIWKGRNFHLTPPSGQKTRLKIENGAISFLSFSRIVT